MINTRSVVITPPINDDKKKNFANNYLQHTYKKNIGRSPNILKIRYRLQVKYIFVMLLMQEHFISRNFSI